MPTLKAAQPPKYHPKLYATSLKIEGSPKSLLLDVETATPQEAAEAAANEWMGGDRCPDISTGAAIYVRHYLLDGTVALDSPFLLDQQSLEQTRRKWAKRAVEKEKYNNQIENFRRQTIARMRQHLAHGQIAEAELDGLKVAFENGHQDHPELKAVVTLERPSSLTGLGALQFRGSAVLAARAVGHSGGDDAWEHWLAILVGYLLENDERGEYIAKQRGISHSGDSEEKVTEIYEIDQLSKASALCCSWLKAGMPASEEFSGKLANSVAAPAAQFEGGQSGRAGETGEDDSSTPHQDADQVRRARAEAVAKLIKELNVLKPQMFEDEKEYNLLQTKYPDFLTFKIAEDRPDLRMKVQCIRGSSRHIRLAQELAGALYGLSWETIADAWKDHKPVRYKRPQAPGKTSKRHSVRPKR